MEKRVCQLALFNLGIDSKLRGCDLVELKVRDVFHGDQAATRAIVMQQWAAASSGAGWVVPAKQTSDNPI